MKIDISLGFEHWINVLASIKDNPADSIHNEHDLAFAIATGFNKDELTVQGAVHKHILFSDNKANWEIVSE